jgi:hypothetical protein
MATKKYAVTVLLISFALAVTIFWFRGSAGHPNQFKVKVFEAGTGWGYDILVNDTLLIHQELMPSLSTKKAFPKKDQAEKTAQLIINKLKAGHQPTVSTLEIEKILQQN